MPKVGTVQLVFGIYAFSVQQALKKCPKWILQSFRCAHAIQKYASSEVFFSHFLIYCRLVANISATTLIVQTL